METTIALSPNSELLLLRKELQSAHALIAQFEERERKLECESQEHSQRLDKIDIQNRLRLKIPFFEFNSQDGRNIFRDLEDPEKRVKLIHGMVQSGKTAVICGLVVYCIRVLGISVVVLVRKCTADFLQLRRKFTEDTFFKPFEIDVHHATTCRELVMFNSQKPALTICLEHQTPMKNVVRAFEDHSSPNPFCLIVDEADLICYKASRGKLHRRVTNPFSKMRDISAQFIAVTATAFDMLYLEYELGNHSIYRIPPNENYKGLQKIEFVSLENTHQFKLDTDGSLSEDMENFYYDLLEEDGFTEVWERVSEGMEKDLFGSFHYQITSEHPIICLQKTDIKIADQLKTLKAFIRHEDFREKFVVLVYNGEGVYAYWPDCLSNSIPVISDCVGQEIVHGRRKSRKRKRNGDLVTVDPEENEVRYLHFKDIGLQEMLQYFRDMDADEDENTFNHFVIIAGQIVGRGLNICSLDYKWHLTHQIMNVSESATCADITQGCRLFGIYEDGIIPKLYCKERDWLDLNQSHDLQLKLFEGADLHELAETMPNLCLQIKLLAENIPKRRTTKKCGEPQWNVQTEAETLDEEHLISDFFANLEERLNEERETNVIRILRFLNGKGCAQAKRIIERECGISNWSHFTSWDKRQCSYKLLVLHGKLWEINPAITQRIEMHSDLKRKLFCT